MILYILVIRHTVFDHRTSDKVFQLILVPLIEGFELVIYIYDKVLTDISECVFLLRIYFSCVTVTVQCWGTEQIKERGLELSLLARQHEAGVVSALAVVHRIGDHRHKPFGKIRQPFVRITDNNAACQIGIAFGER